MISRSFSLFSFFLIFTAAANAQPKNEMVLRDNASIRALLSDFSFAISSAAMFERKIVWRNCEFSTLLHPRRTRWYGSLGAYNPGLSVGLVNNDCNGVSRAVVQEGQIHFDSIEFAKEWLQRRPKSYNNVWLDNGLLVSWAINPARSQFSVDVWLMCLHGRPFQADQKPSVGSIEIVPNNSGQVLQDCASVSADDIKKTKQQLQEFWRSVDALPAHMRGG